MDRRKNHKTLGRKGNAAPAAGAGRNKRGVQGGREEVAAPSVEGPVKSVHLVVGLVIVFVLGIVIDVARQPDPPSDSHRDARGSYGAVGDVLWQAPTGDPSRREVAALRFLFSAVYEGLIDDSVPRRVICELNDPRAGNFADTCLAGLPVRSAITTYHQNFGWTSLVRSSESRLPADVSQGLVSGDRSVRHKAIEALVNRYVTRRFDQLRFTEEERRRLREEVKRVSGPANTRDFPMGCPSCNGSTR